MTNSNVKRNLSAIIPLIIALLLLSLATVGAFLYEPPAEEPYKGALIYDGESKLNLVVGENVDGELSGALYDNVSE